jgi:hypothetical protein
MAPGIGTRGPGETQLEIEYVRSCRCDETNNVGIDQ